jgi:hypothetical protein
LALQTRETNPIGETEIDTPNVTATVAITGAATILMTTAIIDLTGITEKTEKEAETGRGDTIETKERVAKVGLNRSAMKRGKIQRNQDTPRIRGKIENIARIGNWMIRELGFLKRRRNVGDLGIK